MKKLIFFLVSLLIVCCGIVVKAQTATFITLSSAGQLAKVTLGASSCTNTPLTFCSNFTGNPLSIALDGNILYVVDSNGALYKNTLDANGTTGNCIQLGSFSNPDSIAGLTVGPGGIVYAATSSTIETYNPTTNSFATLGMIPPTWTIGGDLLFYKGKLYEAVKVGATTNNALIEINLANVPASTLYMNFNAGSVIYGFASVTMPCSDNQVYALSSNASSSTTDIYAVDMTNKTQATTSTCTLGYDVFDAASIAETQSEASITVPLSFSSCSQVTYLGNVYTNSTTVKDTVKTVQGCDSIIHNVTIIIKQPTSSTTTINSTTPYSWNGTTYTQSGIYIKAGLFNVVGCDSIATLILTINAIDTCWKKISLSNHTVAIKFDGTLWAWGENNWGQLGDGSNINKNIPTQIDTANNWTNISAGYGHTIGIKADGTLWTWGYNNYGQLGDGTHINKNTPTQIGTSNNWKTITGGYDWTVAIKTDGTLWAWGNNIVGQLGNGGISSQIPTQIGTDNNWSSISCGYWYTVAIKTDGTLWAWGYNASGQLGDGTDINKNTPTQIGTANNWATISAEDDHTIGIKADGTLWAWGVNHVGQLGDGTNIDIHRPSQIGTDNNWSSISCGHWYTIAIKTDGTLWTWGWNLFGQLGDGTYTNKNIPTQTGTANNWANIDAGSYQTIAIKTDGSLWAWGDNSGGQFGDGTNISKNIPTLNIHSCNPCPTATTNTKTFTSCAAILYNGFIYNTSTVLRDTVTSIRGCDSVYYVVNINPKTTTTYTQTITSCKAIVYNGSTYYASTVLKDTIKSFLGCDSVYNLLNITINPIIVRTITKTFTSCKAILYNGSAYNTSTIVNDTVKSFQGCDSIYNVINININPITAITNIKTMTSCKAIVYNGTTYNTSTIVNDTVKSFQGCDSIINNVNITITPINAITQTLNLNSCDSVIYKSITYTANTILNDTIKNVQGCDSVYNVVHINAGDRTAFAYITNAGSNTVSVINTEKNTVIATIPVGINPYGVSVSPDNTRVYITNMGSNNVSVINTFNNTVIATIPVGITPMGITVSPDNSKIYVANEGGNEISIISTATNALIGNIQLGINPRYVIVSPDNKRVYVSCGSSTIKIIDAITNSINSTISLGGNIVNGLCLNLDGTRLYTANGVGQSVSVINTLNNTTIATIQTGTTAAPSTIVIHPDGTKIYVSDGNYHTLLVINTVTNNVTSQIYTGISQKGISITPDGTKVLVVNQDQVSIVNTYNNSILSNIIVGTQAIAFGNFIAIVPKYFVTTNTQTLTSCEPIIYKDSTYNTSTTVKDTIKSVYGCDSIYNIHNINIYPGPKVIGGNTVYVLPNSSTILHPAITNGYLYHWSPSIYLNDTTIENPICTPQKDITYKIVVRNQNDCKDSSYIGVIIVNQLAIPNVFSPNGDGTNDTWVIDGLENYSQNTVDIFKSDGQKVFGSGKGKYMPWNGKNDGKYLPAGVYYYVIRLNDVQAPLTGSLILVR